MVLEMDPGDGLEQLTPLKCPLKGPLKALQRSFKGLLKVNNARTHLEPRGFTDSQLFDGLGGGHEVPGGNPGNGSGYLRLLWGREGEGSGGREEGGEEEGGSHCFPTYRRHRRLRQLQLPPPGARGGLSFQVGLDSPVL